MTLLLFLACGDPDGGDSWGATIDGGQSGSLTSANPCPELSRAALEDLSAIPAGATYSAQQAIDAKEGTWRGTWTENAEEALGEPVTLEVTFDGTGEVVAYGSSDVLCSVQYELPATAALISDFVEVTLPVLGWDQGFERMKLFGDVPAEDVAVAPEPRALPARLYFWADLDGALADGGVTWQDGGPPEGDETEGDAEGADTTETTETDTEDDETGGWYVVGRFELHR